MSKQIEYVCPDCFHNESLKARVREQHLISDGEEDAPPTCSFHDDEQGVPIEKLVGIVDPVFRQHYGLAGDAYYGEPGADDLE